MASISVGIGKLQHVRGSRQLAMHVPPRSTPGQAFCPPRAAKANAQRLTRSGSANHASWGPEERDIDRAFGLYVSVRGHGRVTSQPAGIACGEDCEETLPFGAAVKLRARPKSGYGFVRWEGACQGRKDACQLIVDDATAAIARFKPLP